MYGFKTHGVCCVQINFDINEEDNTIKSVQFIGGCQGNTKGVSKLVVGRPIDEVIQLLEGIPCRGNTSCPDQLAQALKAYKEQKGIK